MTQINASIDWATTLTGEILLFGLLGKLLYTDLDREWLQSLIEQDVFAESPFGEGQADVQRGLAYLQAWSQENKSGISDENFMALQTDYTRLFVGIKKVLAPLWESVHLNKKPMVFQEETLQVRNWYRRFGLESEKLNREPDDHIGLELALIAHIARLGLEAWEQNDESAFQELLVAQKAFVETHLGRWALRWCGQVEQHARTDFYLGLAHLTRGSILALADILEIKIAPEKAR